MILLDLPEDVIRYALCLCEISSVTCISQTNKYLHYLAYTPTIWIALVEDLRQRGFIDRPSTTDIRTMSTQSLVEVVMRLVLGPKAWSSPSPRPKSFSRILKLAIPRGRREPNPPQVTACAHIVLHPSIRHAVADAPPYHRNFKLLRGGTYVLFCDMDVPLLGCWRVADDSLLGTYRCTLPCPCSIVDFEAEVIYGGERANIILCIAVETPIPAFVEIISWDFTTGVTALLSRTECTGSRFSYPPLPKICSGVAAVRVIHPLWEEMHIIIDWHAQRYCKILSPAANGLGCQMELIPGFGIFTWTSGMTQEINVVAVTSLSGFWTRVVPHDTADPLLLSNLPHAASHAIKVKDGIIRPAAVTLAVYENPLRRDTYRSWLSIPYSATAVLGGVVTRALLCSFRLSLPEAGGDKFILRQRSCAPATPNTAYPAMSGISYSGHAQSSLWDRGMHRIFPPEAHSVPLILQIPETSCSAQLVSYNGGIGYVTAHTFVLSYFE
ncbi:hypothetical protein C8R44DRAFT_989167 [Mycena epipterygia]|nr:hypothetical protein C8R44DRAFT_989167 [Mycena epipterygia]